MLRVQRDGKRQDIVLGSAKLVTLAEARQNALELRKAANVERRDILAERKDEAAYAANVESERRPHKQAMTWDQRLAVRYVE